MGSLLSKPNLKKITECESTPFVCYACAAHQGWRISMDDAHTLIPALDGDERSIPRSFFAVYDGHGGSLVARYCSQYLYQTLLTSAQYKNNHFESALVRAYINTDIDLLSEAGKKKLEAIAETVTAEGGENACKITKLDAEEQGCTAVSLLMDFEHKIMYCANAGDSRAVLVRSGVPKALSIDHKPYDETELHRIEEAGGYVKGGRVNGNLNLSRTIGDLTYKHNFTLEPSEQIISCVPDVTTEPIDPSIDFIVIACDGIWDVYKNETVADFVRCMLFPSSRLTEQQRVDYLLLSSSYTLYKSKKETEKVKSDLELALEAPWPGDVAQSLEELLKLAAMRLIDKCVAYDGSPFSVGCDNMTAVIVLIQESNFTKQVIATLNERLSSKK